MRKEVPAYLLVKFGEVVWHDEPYPNPITGTVEPADFFGRHKEKVRATDILYSPETHRAIWLIGERRAGKTSMLRLLLHKCQEQSGYVSFEIPWQSIHSVVDFYKFLLYRLGESLGAAEIPNFPAEGTHSWIFRDAFEERQKELQNKELVIGIDELDSILLEQVDEKSKKEILATLTSLSENPRTKILLTTAKDPKKVEEWKASPLVARSELIELPPFEDEDMGDFLDYFIPNCTEDDKQRLCSLSGNWPNYAKALLQELLKLPANDPHRLKNACRNASISIAPTCEHLYRQHWNDVEKRVLLMLVSKGHLLSEEVERLGGKFKAAINELVRRGYILEEDGHYRFRVQLIAEWFEEWTRRPLEEERLDIPSILDRLQKTDPWSEDDGEVFIRVSKEDLRREGF